MYLNSRWILLIVWLVLRILPNDHCRLRLERAAFAAVDSKAVWLVEVRMLLGWAISTQMRDINLIILDPSDRYRRHAYGEPHLPVYRSKS